MEKCGGANAKHILLGTVISACTDADMNSIEVIKNEFKVLDKKPWLELGPKINKWDGLAENLPKWIEAFLAAPDQMQEIFDKLQWLETEVPGAIESAPAAFAELSGLEKAKCIAQCVRTGKDLKNLVSQLKESANNLKTDVVDLKEGLETLAKEMNEGKFIEHGKTCRDAKLNDIKDCYEKIYGPIPAAEKAGGGPGGCCNIF